MVANTPPLETDETERIHHLKVWVEFYEPLVCGDKPFEVRRNDRGFKVGDILVLKEYDVGRQIYTGRECTRRVSYVLSNFPGCLPEFVVLGLQKVEYATALARVRELEHALELRLFAFSILAQRHKEGRNETTHQAAYCWDSNENGARGKAYKYAVQTFPAQDGWYNHAVALVEISVLD